MRRLFSQTVPSQGCVLHVLGRDFDVDRFVATSRLPTYHVRHKGELRYPTRKRNKERHSHNSFRAIASNARTLGRAISGTIRFLRVHRTELARLRRTPGVTYVYLDFGVNVYHKHYAYQEFAFPPELTTRAGELGIIVFLTCYQAEAMAKAFSAIERRRSKS